ncbi:hypothetical protein C1H46_028623 [Malus baccata]|uniref:Uncharacterized protein n=1 Tax=Malus baccata TaxID=106549 RepID=A0A540LH54_MALBA|nr:hypothetical protein C1H46_028623 [Malus baccata]
MREYRKVKESQRKSREGVEAEPFDDDRRVDMMIEEETEENHLNCPVRQGPTSSKAPISEPRLDPQSTCPESTLDPSEDDRTDSKPTLLNQTDFFRALEVVERDSLAIADSFTSLFASLRLALSEVTSNSADHMHCFGEAAGGLQESVLDAATKTSAMCVGLCHLSMLLLGYLNHILIKLYLSTKTSANYHFNRLTRINKNK